MTVQKTRTADWADWLLMDPDERDEWAQWFQRHGIDPNTVLTPGSVAADDAARTVTYLAVIVDDRGYPVADPDTGRFTQTRRTVQLEAPALPFPLPGDDL